MKNVFISNYFEIIERVSIVCAYSRKLARIADLRASGSSLV